LYLADLAASCVEQPYKFKDCAKRLFKKFILMLFNIERPAREFKTSSGKTFENRLRKILDQSTHDVNDYSEHGMMKKWTRP
jgi:hypothetical protein